MKNSHKQKIRSFILKHIRNNDLQDDDDLFGSGFVNSLFALELVLFIENEFSISIENTDLDLDNFRSVNAIASLVERKNIEVD